MASITIIPTATSNHTNSTSTIVSLSLSSSTKNYAAQTPQSPSVTGLLVVGVSVPILIALLVVLIITMIVLLWNHRRKSAKQKQTSEHHDGSYSTLNRGSSQAQIASGSANLYEQIQLSPSTGQTDIIPTAEGDNTSRNSTSQPDIHHIYSSIDIEQSQPSLNRPTQQVTALKQSEEDNTMDGPTYAVVEKSRERNKEQMNEDDSGKEGPPVPPYNPLNHSILKQEAQSATLRTDPKRQGEEDLEEMYAIVNEKPKMGEEETAPPPIPPHPVEELYTAIKKNPTAEAVDDKIGTAISMKDNEAYGMASTPVYL